jgi:succinyl-diaminopimelate desuccinylase
VIPAAARARFNSRYNDLWTRERLQAAIEARLSAVAAEGSPVHWRLEPEPAISDVFLTRDEALIGVVSAAIETVVGIRPALSTAGGTSDARFIKNYCPVVEFGPVGDTMHQVDERVPVAEIERAAAVYEEILRAYFAG